MYLSLFSAVLSITLRIFGALLFGLEGTICFRVFAEIISCFLIVVVVYRKYLVKAEKKCITKSLKSELLKFSVNNMIANGIWVIFMITDIFLIGRILNNPEDLANYKVAYVLPSNMAIVTAAIGVFVTPYFVKHEKNFQWVRKNYFKVVAINLIIVGAMAFVLFALAPQLIFLLYGDSYLNTVLIMRLLIVAHFFNASIKSITASLLASMGYAKENMWISLFAFVLQVIMAVNILPRFGLTGLAVNNIFVYLLMAGITFIVFVKKFNIFAFKLEK